MSANQPITVSIADSHKVFRQSIKQAFKEKERLKVVWEAESGPQLLECLDKTRPDVLLMNLGIAGNARFRQAIPMLRQVYNPVKIIVFTLRNDPDIVTSVMDTGANACLARATNPEEIYRAILSCRQNGFYFDNLIEKVGLSVRDVQRIYRKAVKLSEKEILLLRMLAEDMLTKEISQQLRLSSRRVEALRQDMKAKIG
ncbi:MAG TPA: response regulator transcription factor, partial [Chitinophagaceae bacterium]